MKRSSFARKPYTAQPRGRQWTGDALPSPRATVVVPAVLRLVEPVEKERPVRDEAYRRLVAALPCANCKVVGFSQAAHGPTLGAHIKATDEGCFPLCCARPGITGCHYLFDTYQLFDRWARDVWAEKWAKETRKALT